MLREQLYCVLLEVWQAPKGYRVYKFRFLGGGSISVDLMIFLMGGKGDFRFYIILPLIPSISPQYLSNDRFVLISFKLTLILSQNENVATQHSIEDCIDS